MKGVHHLEMPATDATRQGWKRCAHGVRYPLHWRCPMSLGAHAQRSGLTGNVPVERRRIVPRTVRGRHPTNSEPTAYGADAKCLALGGEVSH